jgi:hypothetical protein
MNYESQSQDDLLAGDLAGAESPKNMNNILSGGYSKGNFGGPMKFKGPNLISGKKSTPKKENNSTTGRKDGDDASIYGSIKRGFVDPRTDSVTPTSALRGLGGLISGESWKSNSK